MRSLRLLLTLALLVIGALVATVGLAAAAGDIGQIGVTKTMCTSFGQQNTCSDKDTSLVGYKIDFRVYAGSATSGTPVQTITVTLGSNAGGGGGTGGGSQGRSIGGDLDLGTYTVCEVPTAYKAGQSSISLDVLPRPSNSSGGANQSSNGPNCITVELTKGTAELDFLDKRDVPPTATPTNTPVPPTNTPVPPTATPTNTPVPPTATPTNTPVPPTDTPEPTATPTNTPEPTATPIYTPEPTNTPVNTPEPTSTPDPTETPVPPTATATNTPQPTATISDSDATKVPTATDTAVPPTATKTPTDPAATPTATAVSSDATQVPTATPQVTQLPKTGDAQDGSLTFIGLVLALGGALAYRLASVQQPATAKVVSDEPDSRERQS